MRPVKRPQGAFAHPLNAILGTEANVRVLRVLMLSDIPVGTNELARLAALQASGVPRVCAQLEDLGVIESVGRGRTRQYRRSQRGGLSDSLGNLFRAERQRVERIFQTITQIASSVDSARSVWIEGPVARAEDQPGDPIVVGALAEAASAGAVREALWNQLLSLQQSEDIVVDLRVYTEADLKTADSHALAEFESARPIAGAPPIDIAKPRPVHSPKDSMPRVKRHEDVDARLLRLAAAIADRIRIDPSVVESAKEFLERRLMSASPGERLELREWRDILNSMSPARIRRLMVQDDARGKRLRQSMPFLNVLSPADRARLLKN